MNPFDLSGPAFLVFYIGVALIVVIGLKLVIEDAERGAPRALPLNDPYQIAWLRGGTPEAARIAVHRKTGGNDAIPERGHGRCLTT